MRIAFIGLGVMGAPMAANLLAAGHQLSLSRVTPGRHDALIDAGGEAADTAAAAAKDAEVVIVMVPDTPDVEEVLFGPDGVAESLQPGTLVIDMSSISPTATKEFAARITTAGGHYLDAPVSGGEVGAKAGTPVDHGRRHRLPTSSEPSRSWRCWAPTSPTSARSAPARPRRCANQIIVALTIEAVAEALTFAEAAGADPAKVRAALLGGFASSKILELHGERMITRSFDPGFRIRLHRKDLNLAVSGATELDLALPCTALAQQLMNAAVAAGDGDADHSALVSTVRRLGGVTA